MLPLRISLRSSSRTPAKKTSKIIPPSVLTSAERMRDYRRKLKLDPEKYAKYLQAEAERNRIARAKRSREKKDHDNALAYERTKRYRQRQKEAREKEIMQSQTTPKSLTKPITRNEQQKKKAEQDKKREYWKMKKREERAKMTPQQKRRAREKRNCKRLEAKKYTLSTPSHKSGVTPNKKKTISTPEGNQASSSQPYSNSAAKRKALFRARKCLPHDAIKFAEIVSLLVDNATPRKKQALKAKGLNQETKAKRKIAFCVLDNIKEQMEQFKHSNKKSDKVKRHYLAKNLSVLKKFRSLKFASKTLNTSYKYLLNVANYKVKEKKRKNALSYATISKIQLFYQRPDISSELPCKKNSGFKNSKAKVCANKNTSRVIPRL